MMHRSHSENKNKKGVKLHTWMSRKAASSACSRELTSPAALKRWSYFLDSVSIWETKTKSAIKQKAITCLRLLGILITLGRLIKYETKTTDARHPQDSSNHLLNCHGKMQQGIASNGTTCAPMKEIASQMRKDTHTWERNYTSRLSVATLSVTSFSRLSHRLLNKICANKQEFIITCQWVLLT